VAATAPGAGTPGGSVQFQIDGANFGSAVTLVNGVASSAAMTSLSVGGHSITAVYSGNASYTASTSVALSQTVNAAASGTTLTSSANPATLGQSITFRATMAAVSPGAGTPTGTVQFVLDGANFGTPVTVVNGIATSAATSTLAAGSHTVN